MDERQENMKRGRLEEDVNVESDIAPSNTEDNVEEYVTEINRDSKTEQEYENSIEETEERSTEERVNADMEENMENSFSSDDNVPLSMFSNYYSLVQNTTNVIKN
ncbi:unnamed protein product [Parnassius apollo]|uniref:(apollo) hypothetical protein n=1 Tax=Parnassius apollo TaxID=110799 RepID=A0A8S3W3D0_PARAO|nr:unnamed protein product [Parnassius apollo]